MDKSKLYGTRIENVKYINSRFVDFSQATTSGRASFLIELYPEDAMKLKENGWPIKEYVSPNYPDSDPRYSLNIYVKFKNNDGTFKEGKDAPHIFQASGRKRVLLTPEQCINLNRLRFSNARLEINPYFSKKDPSKFTAYANEVTFEIDDNPPSSNGFNDSFKDLYD